MGQQKPTKSVKYPSKISLLNIFFVLLKFFLRQIFSSSDLLSLIYAETKSFIGNFLIQLTIGWIFAEQLIDLTVLSYHSENIKAILHLIYNKTISHKVARFASFCKNQNLYKV